MVKISLNRDDQPGVNHLYIRESEGTLKQLTGGNWQDIYAQWTADGRYIYFNSNSSGVANIYRLKMNGADCVKTSLVFGIQDLLTSGMRMWG
ncbi:TolB family protein [Marinicella meishanensis]|uniref:TolB family protein n=1 Tax=Marinicella meishanensis TaxID=2873263 RepID=UPI001CBF1C1F|nr:DPP IV N-terminal domain-containing protein [Marinicella sp. NBU2979]